MGTGQKMEREEITRKECKNERLIKTEEKRWEGRGLGSNLQPTEIYLPK